LVLTPDGNGGTDITFSCFLEGTRVTGATGEVAIEDLHVGDLVATLVDGAWRMAPVKWLGQRIVNAADLPHDDGYPIRIKAHAIADTVPRRDLLVTGDHGILLGGALIPARMLVNGRTITVDDAIKRYRFYHIELEQHAFLCAEGLAAESYLDTGNRANFSNAGVVTLRPDWQAEAPAAARVFLPLTVDRAVVEPIWKSLEIRAIGRGVRGRPAKPATNDPDLRLLTEDGETCRFSRGTNGDYRFAIPPDARVVRLLSRTARPSDVEGPFVDDRRALGVAVHRIVITDGEDAREIDFSAEDLSGWHAPEPAARWTRGDTWLYLDASPHPRILIIRLSQMAAYPIDAGAVGELNHAASKNAKKCSEGG
jgi:hypothetical protein